VLSPLHCNKCLPLILPDQIITNFCYKQTDPEMHKIRNLHSTTQEIELQMKLTRKRNHHELKNHYEIDPQMKSREHHYEIESLRLERWATTPVPAPGEVGSVDGSGLEGGATAAARPGSTRRMAAPPRDDNDDGGSV
jgi:hypothetical protein